MTTEKNRIVLGNPVTQKRRAEYHLEVSGPWARYFRAADFYAEYSHSVEFASYAILMVPVLRQGFCAGHGRTEEGSLREISRHDQGKLPGVRP